MSTTNEALQKHVESIADDLVKIYDGAYPEQNEDGEDMTFYDYFYDPLDIEYRIGYDRQFRSVKLLVAFGGPNIWVDTGSGEVVGAWWTDSASAWIPREVCNEIDTVFEELFYC